MGPVWRVQPLDLVLWIVVDDEFDGVKDAHHTRRHGVEGVAYGPFEVGHINDGVGFGHADAVYKIANGLGGDAETPETAEGGHPGVIPA